MTSFKSYILLISISLLTSCQYDRAESSEEETLGYVEGYIPVNDEICMEDEIYINSKGAYTASYDWIENTNLRQRPAFPKGISGTVMIVSDKRILLDASLTLPDMESVNAIEYRLINSVDSSQFGLYKLRVCIKNNSLLRSGMFKFGVTKYHYEGWLR